MMNKWKTAFFGLLMVLAIGIGFVACDPTGTDQNASPTVAVGVKTSTQASQDAATLAVNKWGNVNITNYYEYEQLKNIYELRDNPNLILYAYSQDMMTGKFVCMGLIKGFPIPYSTELSQPTGPTYSEYQGSTNDPIGSAIVNEGSIPEPNGLFPSQSTQADWVDWIDPKTGKSSVGFIEANVQTFQVQLTGPAVEVPCQS